MPGDSCLSQLLSIIHEIYKSIDYSPPVDVRGKFLEISKAFVNVWHAGFFNFKIAKIRYRWQLLKVAQKWANIVTEKHFSRCSTGIYFGPIIVSNIYK